MKAFFVKGRSRWGYSAESLYDAMRKAGIYQGNPLKVYADAIDEAVHSEENPEEWLQDADTDMEHLTRAHETEFQVQIVPVEWELKTVSDIDGSPTWAKCAGESTTTVLLCEVTATGRINIKESKTV